MRTILACILPWVLCLTLVSPLRSASDILVPDDAYAELYLKNPKVSGNLLVGLRWDGPAGSFDPYNVRMRVTDAVAGAKACVDVSSKDGRYTAENIYTLATAAGPEPRLYPYPKTLYESELKGYSVDQMAVMIRAISSCDTPEFGTVIPAIVAPPTDAGGTFNGGRLIAYVNADPDRVSISLLGPDKKELSRDAVCQSPGDGVHIAYSTICTLDLAGSPPGRGVVLRLATKERFRTIDTDFDILVTK